MKSTINIITPGEIKLGMYVIALGEKEFAYKYKDDGEIKTQTHCPQHNPWFKGIPFKVIGIAGPIIAIQTAPQADSMPSVTFYDARLVELAEVPKKFYQKYFDIRTGADKKPKKTKDAGSTIKTNDLADNLKYKTQ